jgi:hypothetical protein
VCERLKRVLCTEDMEKGEECKTDMHNALMMILQRKPQPSQTECFRLQLYEQVFPHWRHCLHLIRTI